MKKITLMILFMLLYYKSKEVNYLLPSKPIINVESTINNNPFNIIKNNKNLWLGKSQTSNRFEKFVNIEYGIRAGIVLIKNYQKVHKILTIEDLIYKFAPPCENNTEQYINFISLNLNVHRNDKFSVNEQHVLIELCRLILIKEGYDITRVNLYKIINKYNL